MHVVRHLELEAFATAVFLRAGASVTNADLVARHLVDANLAGHDSHGVIRISQYLEAIEAGTLLATAEPEVTHEFGGGAVIDGQSAFGQVVGKQAMELAKEKARRSGIGAVTARNCYHSGRIGAYTESAARDGMIGIVMVNAGGGGQSVAPFGGGSRRLATNPISIASPPCDPYPLVLDIASSVAPEGKIRDYLQRESMLPQGWIIDAQGQPTVDPRDFYGPPVGALLPFGGQVGYKGFGLAFMIDILAGALSGAGCCSQDLAIAKDGILAVAIDVSQFGPIEGFHRTVLKLVAHVKSCAAAPGFEEVFVPGEIEHRARELRLSSGISVPESVWNEFTSIARHYQLPLPALIAGNGLQSKAQSEITSPQAAKAV